MTPLSVLVFCRSFKTLLKVVLKNTWRSVLPRFSPHQIMYPVVVMGSVCSVAVQFVLLRSVTVCVLFLVVCISVCMDACVRECFFFYTL